MKKRILSALIAVVICIIFVGIVSVPATEQTTTITVGDAETNNENGVTVPISISNNVGLVGLTLAIEYDSNILTLNSITRGEALSSLVFTKPGDLSLNIFKLLWDGTDEDSTNGSIVSLEFTITDGAQYTEDLIDVTVVTACDEDLDNVETVVQQGLLSSGLEAGSTNIVETIIPNLDVTDSSTLSENISTEIMTNQVISETVSDATLENLDNDLGVNINLIYNNEYYEAILKKENTLGVSFSGTNTVDKDLICYLAEYSSDGYLLSLTSKEESADENLSKTFSNSNTASVKIFLWEEDTFKPIMGCITLQPEQSDYYADTKLKAQSYDISKIINGKIDSALDVDYIKFTPTITGRYIIHAIADVNINGELCDLDETFVVSGNTFGNGYYYKTDLVAGNTYYLKTSGSAVGEYSIGFNIMQSDGLAEITNDSIKFAQSYDSDSQVNVNLYSSGTLIQSKTATPNNNKVVAEFDVDDLASAYTITVEEDGYVTALYEIKTVQNIRTYNVTEKSYVSVPVTVTNATDLTDINFVVAFDEDEFSVFDVCEQTYDTLETGTGILSNAEMDIKAIYNNAVIFTSIKNLLESWSGNVNTIKLQANGSGDYTIRTIAYTVK